MVPPHLVADQGLCELSGIGENIQQVGICIVVAPEHVDVADFQLVAVDDFPLAGWIYKYVELVRNNITIRIGT